MKTMTASQMNWNLKNGFAWFCQYENGDMMDEWTHPIWTREGGWIFDNSEKQQYELCIV